MKRLRNLFGYGLEILSPDPPRDLAVTKEIERKRGLERMEWCRENIIDKAKIIMQNPDLRINQVTSWGRVGDDHENDWVIFAYWGSKKWKYIQGGKVGEFEAPNNFVGNYVVHNFVLPEFVGDRVELAPAGDIFYPSASQIGKFWRSNHNQEIWPLLHVNLETYNYDLFIGNGEEQNIDKYYEALEAAVKCLSRL